MPADGSVTVAPVSISPVQEHWTTITGSLAGVAGRLERLPNKTHQFTRAHQGEPVSSSEPVEFRSDSEFCHEGKLAIFWTVRGNYLETEQIVADTLASIERLGHDRFVVIGALNIKQPGHVEFDAVLTLNKRLSETFGNRFIDIRSFIIEHERRRFEAGARRPNDRFELNNVPVRLRVDVIHFDDKGNQLLSLLVAAHLEQLGIMSFPDIHREFERVLSEFKPEEAIASLSETYDGRQINEALPVDARDTELASLRVLNAELEAERARLECAVVEHESTQAQLEAATASAASLQSDLATARTALDSMQGLREAQSEAIAALTRRLETEIERADDLRRAFQVQERDLRAQIVARENAFATLVRERDDLMDRFREHIGHYDALRDELDRRTAADDETYEQVLLLAGRIRSFADRWSSLPASGQADNIQAARALHELSSALLNAKAAVGGLAGIAAGLDAPAAPGLVAPTPQPAQ